MTEPVATYPSTPRQREFIKAVAKVLNISESDLDTEAETMFGSTIATLNRRDASIMIERLQKRRQQPEVKS